MFPCKGNAIGSDKTVVGRVAMRIAVFTQIRGIRELKQLLSRGMENDGKMVSNLKVRRGRRRWLIVDLSL